MSTQDFWKATKFEWFEIFCWLALIGLLLLLASHLFEGVLSTTMLVSGGILVMPFIIHGNLLAIWHWKERYRGKHSFLWGALIILETSGWFKLVYLFRHIIPDRRGSGRYARLAEGVGGSS